MRFHYILRGIHKPEGGVWSVCKKIRGQLKNLREQQVEVLLHQYHEIWDSVSIEKMPVRFYQNNSVFGSYLRLKRDYLVNIELDNLIRKSGRDDVLYFRYPFSSIFLITILKKPRKCKVVLEYQSIEPLEWKLKGEWFSILNDRIFGGPVRKYTDAIVGVTDEITDYELKRSGDPGKKHITIGNGFDVDSVCPRKPPQFNRQELSLISVSQVNRWHGIDRIIHGIAAYSGSCVINLHIVGTGLEIPTLKKLVSQHGLNDRVIFHGFLTGTELDQLFDQCHVAIGSLGIHRIGLKEASILKAREYCSRGIPFFSAYADPDFPDDFCYALKVPADDTPISIEDIIQFANSVYSDGEHPVKMHAYALKNLDWSGKMQKLKVFLENQVL
jgi:glycosyltransferase involved in cell wall biosynthesis